MTDRRPELLEIVPLTPERLSDLAALFAQGGDPSWCWCAYYRRRGAMEARRQDRITANRGVFEAATFAAAAEGRAPGLIAYRGGEAVGWVSVGPREDYARLEHSSVLKRLDERPVWSIVCFVVGRASRGQGIAGALLEAAVAYAQEHGATLLEAYPVDTGGRRIHSAYAFGGTLGMYERAGFTVAARRRATPTSAPRPIVRHSLGN